MSNRPPSYAGSRASSGYPGSQYDNDHNNSQVRSRPVSTASLPNKSMEVASAENVNLKRNVGLPGGVALIVGTMIGSGIFISPSGVVEGSGSIGLSLISWLICGIISMLAAISYAELGTLIPKSGAEYAYLYESFGPLNEVVGRVPAFLFCWTNTVLLKPAAIAIISLAFAQYTLAPFFTVCVQPVIATKCLAIFCVLVLCIINCFSVRAATWLQVIFTITKLVAILVIVLGGFAMLAQGNTQYLATGFDNTETNVGKIAIGWYNGMWAYDGWNNLNFVTEEIVNHNVNLPRAICIGVPIVIVCYLLTNISYFTVVSPADLLTSPAVAVTWGNRVLGVMAWIIPISVACSCIGAANGTFFSTGRLNFVAAREGHTIEILSMIHVRRYTPMPSLVFTAILTVIFIIPGNIGSLIEFFNFAVWLFYGATMVSFLVLRYTLKDVIRPFKVPIFIPIIVLIASIFLVIAPIASNPRLEFLYAFLFIIGGLIFYIPFVHFEKHPACMNGVTAFFQNLFECSPPTEEPGG